ncbi:MAG: molybdopterin-binding protein [Eubacteriales bacterium]|nr:molybdopterin-binding protein [Eubacteriales bacterium]
MGNIRAICISEKKGTVKRPVERARVTADYGIEQDAHAGKWHRQISLLSWDKVADFNARGGNVTDGDFGENLLIEGIDCKALPVGTVLRAGEVVLEITQIGKECHQHCQIYHRVGDCIMPREGVFAKVLQGGELEAGMAIEVISYGKTGYHAAVITASDSGARGEREDVSGPLLARCLEERGYTVVEQLLLPDDREGLEKAMKRLADSRQVDLILTTGGTGFSLRDQMPEATMAVADRNAPGIAEAIRYYSLQLTKRAMLSRAVSVLRGQTLIINLPGSPKAVKECMDWIGDQLDHGLGILCGRENNCAR